MASQRVAFEPPGGGWYQSFAQFYADAGSYAVVRHTARWGLRIVLLAILVAFWQLLVTGSVFGELQVLGTGWVNDAILPRTDDIADEMWFLLFDSGFFWEHWWQTLRNTLAGFAIGSVLGASLAIAMVLWPRTRAAISDSAIAFEAIPKVTIIPVLFAWFGFGGQSMMILAVMITFFPVFLTSLVGMTHVPEDDIKLMNSFRCNRYQMLYMMRFPHALPNVFGGLKIGIANAMIGAILAEFLFGNSGLGFLVDLYYNTLRVPEEFAAMFLIAITFVILFGALEITQRFVVFWSKTAEEIIAGK